SPARRTGGRAGCPPGPRPPGERAPPSSPRRPAPMPRPRCRRVLPAWGRPCPACGTPVSTPGEARRAAGASRRWLLAWLLVSGAVILFALVLPVARRLPLSWWTIPLVREVLARARDHPGVLRAIGEPVRLRGLVTREVPPDGA